MVQITTRSPLFFFSPSGSEAQAPDFPGGEAVGASHTAGNGEEIALQVAGHAVESASHGARQADVVAVVEVLDNDGKMAPGCCILEQGVAA